MGLLVWHVRVLMEGNQSDLAGLPYLPLLNIMNITPSN